jgi:hypothetical protein
VQAKAIANSLTPKHPAFDEARGLFTFGYLLCREPETAFTECASSLLRADKIDYLNQKFPRQNFESTEEWAAAVAKEIQSVLLPVTPGFAALEPDSLNPATDTRRIAQLFLTTVHARNFLDDDLDQEERLDARIAKLIRELIEIKSNKQVLRRAE